MNTCKKCINIFIYIYIYYIYIEDVLYSMKSRSVVLSIFSLIHNLVPFYSQTPEGAYELRGTVI